jgi:dimethylhistidine N-methyltransferase
VTPLTSARQRTQPAADQAQARLEIIQGLRRRPKLTPAKFLYDAQGSELFEQICRLPEYYLTRVELALLRRHVRDIAGHLGRRVTLVEPGAGAGAKVRLFLDCPDLVAAYVPIDVSRTMLTHAANSLRIAYPATYVHPIVGDFTRHLATMPLGAGGGRVIFFPGSTIGNYTPDEARRLLGEFKKVTGEEGSMLVSMDHCKGLDVLLPAYNDAAGITALFNKNLLYRLNRDFSADFRPDYFSHSAAWSEQHHRIEMHLVSHRTHCVCVGPHEFRFEAGESLVTEYSYKPTVAEFEELVASAGLRIVARWIDPRFQYGIYCLN